MSEKIYKGWLMFTQIDISPEQAEEELTKLGVEVLSYNSDDDEFRVEMSDEVLTKLDPLWGRFIWGLI